MIIRVFFLIRKTVQHLMIIFIGMSLILSGCEVDYYQEPEDNQGSGSSLFGDSITVPAGFDWATMRTVNVNVKVDDQYNGSYYYIVELFDANPIFSQEAKLLAKGVAKQGQNWIATVDFSSHLEAVYVRQTSPIGQGVVKVVSTSGENLSVDFTPNTPVQTRAAYQSQAGSTMSTRSGEEGPSTIYPTPADVEVIDNTVSSITLQPSYWPEAKHKAYVIRGDYTGSITFNGGSLGVSLYIEGAWTNTSSTTINMGASDKFIIQNGGKFISNEAGTLAVNSAQLIVAENGEFGKEGTLMTLSQNDDRSRIINSGTLGASGLSNIRYLYNYGDINLEGTMNADNSTSSIVNKGNFIINNGTGDTNKLTLRGNFQNEGSVKISGTVDFQNTGSLTNTKTGTFEVNTFNNPKTIINEGVMKISGILNANSSGFSLTNTGFFEVHTLGSSDPSAKGTINNNGQFIITNNAVFELTFNIGTGGLLEANNLTMYNSTITLADNAMLTVTGRLTVSTSGAAKIIRGPAAGNALAKINEVAVPNYTNFQLQGELEVECSNYEELPEIGTTQEGNTVGGDVRFVKVGESTVTIPASEYNKGGNDSSIPDTPPTHPTFPIIYEGAALTYLFEDNWPYLGDYDMNDLVLDITPTYSTNADNKVTRLQLDVTLRAAGATKRLAVGLQLDGITSGAVSSVSRTNTAGINGGVFTQSNGLETGQTYAVIPVFDDAHVALGHSSPLMTNTIKGSENNKSPIQVTFTIDFTSPLDQANISVDKFNVFIINGGYKTNRQEIHLSGFQPTDKADTSKFGLADSNSEKPYTSRNNMIWGLAIPGPAKYPMEWTSIRLAYPGLESWATSGGTSGKDWYKNSNENRVYD